MAMSSVPEPSSPPGDLPLEPAETRKPAKGRAAFWLIVKLAITAAVLCFVVRALVDRFREIDWAHLQMNIPCLLGAVALLGAAGVVYGTGYRMLLGAFCPPPTWSGVLAAVWVSQLGKYVPGKVASVAGGVYLLKKQNVPATVALSINVVIMGLFVVAGLLLMAPLSLLDRTAFLGPLTGVWTLVLLVAGLVGVHPRVFVGLVNLGLRLLGREPLAARPRLRDYVGPMALLLVQWLLFGLSLWMVARSVADVPLTQAPFFISVAAAATTLGFLAIFTPAGIGVREGILLVLLEPALGPKTAIVIVAARFFQAAVEAGLAGIGFVILRAGGSQGRRADRETCRLPNVPDEKTLNDSYDEAYYAYIANEMQRGVRSYRWRMRWLDELLDVQPGQRVLDLGSGAGVVSQHLADRGAAVEAVDLSPVGVEAARRRCAHMPIRFTVCDAAHCNHLESDSFDKATCCDLVEHVQDNVMLGIFREAHRLLKPGGLLFVYTPNRRHWIERMKAHNFILNNPVSHIRVHTLEEVVEALQDAGFQIARIARPPSMLPVIQYLEWLWIRLPIAPSLAIYRLCLLARKPQVGCVVE